MMYKTQPDLKITYSDYHYLINLFEGEYDSNEIMTKSKIDDTLKFSQSPTTADFFAEILQHSSIIIPNDTQLDNECRYITNLIDQKTSQHDIQAINQFVENIRKIKNIPMDQRPVYARDSFDIRNDVQLSQIYSHIFSNVGLDMDSLEIKPVTYEEFMDAITDIQMQFN